MGWVQEIIHLFWKLFDLFLHLDKYLNQVIQQYGATTYALLFSVVFLETGLVVTPFLPGDSLLFAAGAFCATGSLQLPFVLALLFAAAVIGDATNYAIGKFLGRQMVRSRWIKKQHLDKTAEFYKKYGSKTIVLARFVPIVRTIAPFLAGSGQMTYLRFFTYNVVGGGLWVSICVLAGYFFGNFPVVKNNFSLVVIAIILLSVLPIGIELWKGRKAQSSPMKI